MIELGIGLIVGIVAGWLLGTKSRFWKPSHIPESRIYWDTVRVNDDAETWTT